MSWFRSFPESLQEPSRPSLSLDRDPVCGRAHRPGVDELRGNEWKRKVGHPLTQRWWWGFDHRHQFSRTRDWEPNQVGLELSSALAPHRSPAAPCPPH